jgi:hypothetical protein
MLREFSGYTGYIQRAITNISVCTAIAEYADADIPDQAG